MDTRSLLISMLLFSFQALEKRLCVQVLDIFVGSRKFEGLGAGPEVLN